MAYVKKQSVLPIYLIGLTWLVWAIFGPLYRPTHYIMAALASAAVYFLGKILFPDSGYQVQDKSEESSPQEEQDAKSTASTSPEIQALLEERNRALSELDRIRRSLDHPTLKEQIGHLMETTDKIMDAVVDKPDKLPQIRRFLNYYLPTTLKLLNAYDRMDDAGVSGTNIDGTKGRIEDIMNTICAAFDRQLDALYSQEALDISTDITVLEQMLAQEGLSHEDFSDPS